MTAGVPSGGAAKSMKGSLPARYGPWAVVAGASQGLGAAFAEDLARRGMNVVLVARRGQLLEEVAGRLRAAHKVDVRCVTLDLASADFTVKLADAVADIDLGIVIYNAARIPIGSFLDMDEDVLEQVERVNVRGPLLLARALLPAMRERGRGALVLVSSLAGMQGAPRFAAYSASKAFNTILAEALWAELRDHGIDVSVCCAGAMPTPGYLATTKKAAPGMLAPETAARQTLDALGEGPRFVPGLINRISAQLMGRFLTRKAAIRLIDSNTRHMS